MRKLFMRLVFRFIGIKTFKPNFKGYKLDANHHNVLDVTKDILCIDTTGVSEDKLSKYCYHNSYTRGIAVPYRVFGKTVHIVFAQSNDASCVMHELVHAYQFLTDTSVNDVILIDNEVKRIKDFYGSYLPEYYVNIREVDARITQYKFEDMNNLADPQRI